LTATSIPSPYLPRTEVRFADKGVHFFLYAVLALLLGRAMHSPTRTSRLVIVVEAILLASAMGAVDEWHQRFVPGRSTELLDWVADTVGGVIGAVVWVAEDRYKATRTT
jgi:VanZ family protein